MRNLFCKISDRETLNANLLETKPKKVKFVPAYSGGKLFTSGITIPEPIQIGDETYAAGTSFPTVVDLDTIRIEENVPILYSHNPDYRLGHTYSVKCDGETVTAEGLLESPSQWNQEVITSFKAGARWQASLGSGLVDPTTKEIVPAGETRSINGQMLAGPYIILHDLALREISIVPAGADPNTEVLLASLHGVNTMNFDEFCASKGFDLATLDEANKTALEALFNALNAPEGDPANEAVEAEAPCEEEAEAAEAAPAEPEVEKEEVKASALTRVFPSLNVPKYSAQKAEPAPTGAEIFQASALLNLGVPGEWLTENGYSKRCVDLADKKAGEASILSAMGEALTASGIKPDYRNPHAIVRAYSELLKASNVGTKTFGDVNVFSPIIDKQMRYRYELLEPMWQKLYRKRTVRDFNQVATVDFDVLGKAKDLVENEDFPVVALKSSGAKFNVDRQGLTAAISFENQINDDLGAIDRIGDDLLDIIVDSQMAKFWTTFWACVNTNYTTAKKNKITNALSVDGISAAKTAFSSQKNANGRFLHTPAKALLVPSALEDVALHIFNWPWAGKETTEGNVHIGKYDVIADPNLGA
ncbi:MAG: hypothetical protein ACI4UF_06805, partial [Thermoguttaceae bacterium]